MTLLATHLSIMDLGLTHPPESQQQQETCALSEEDEALLASLNAALGNLPDGFDFAGLGLDLPDNALECNGNQLTPSMTQQATPQGHNKRSVDDTGFDRENGTDCTSTQQRKKQRSESQVITNPADISSPCTQPANHLGAARKPAGSPGPANPSDERHALESIPAVRSTPSGSTAGQHTEDDRAIHGTTSSTPPAVVNSIEGPDRAGTLTIQSVPSPSRIQTPTAALSLPGGLSRDVLSAPPSTEVEVSTISKGQARTDREGSYDSLFGEDIDMPEGIASEEPSVNLANDSSSDGRAVSEHTPVEQLNSVPHTNVPSPVSPAGAALSLPKAPATFQSRTLNSPAQEDNSKSRDSIPASAPLSLPKAPAPFQDRTPTCTAQEQPGGSRVSAPPTITPISLPNTPAAFQSGTQYSTGQNVAGQFRASAALAHKHMVQPQDVAASQSRQIVNIIAPPELPITPYPKHNGPLEYLPSTNNLHVRSVRVSEDHLVSQLNRLESRVAKLQREKKCLMAELSEHVDLDPATGKSKLQILKDENSTLRRQGRLMQAQLKDLMLKHEGLMEYCQNLHKANAHLMQHCALTSAQPTAQANVPRPPMPVSSSPLGYSQQHPVAMDTVRQAPGSQPITSRPPIAVGNTPQHPPVSRIPFPQKPRAQPIAPRPPVTVGNTPGGHRRQSVSTNPFPQVPVSQPNAQQSPMSVGSTPGAHPQQQSVVMNSVPPVPGSSPQVSAGHSPVRTSIAHPAFRPPSAVGSVDQPTQQIPSQHPLGPTEPGSTGISQPSQPVHAPNFQQTTPRRQQAWTAPAVDNSAMQQPIYHPEPARPAMFHQARPQATARAPMGPVTCAPDFLTVYNPNATAQTGRTAAAAAPQPFHPATPAGPVAPGSVDGSSNGSEVSTQEAHPVHSGSHQQFSAPAPGPAMTTAPNPAKPVATCAPSVQEQAINFGAVQPQLGLQAPVAMRPHRLANRPDPFMSPNPAPAARPFQTEMRTSSAPNPVTVDLTGDQSNGAGGQQNMPQQTPQTPQPERPGSRSIEDFYQSIRSKKFSWLGDQNHTTRGYRYKPPTYVPPMPQPKSRRNSRTSVGRKSPINSPANPGKVQKTPKRATKPSPAKGSKAKKSPAKVKSASPAPEPETRDADALTAQEEEYARILEEAMMAD